MNIKEKVQNKYANWEIMPKRRNVNSDAIAAAEKTPITFSEVKKKYSNAREDEAVDETPAKQGIDKQWKPFMITPKDKNTDILMEEKTRFFDENGTEVASQG